MAPLPVTVSGLLDPGCNPIAIPVSLSDKTWVSHKRELGGEDSEAVRKDWQYPREIWKGHCCFRHCLDPLHSIRWSSHCTRLIAILFLFTSIRMIALIVIQITV